MEAAENRRLKRKLRELELKLKTGGGGGGVSTQESNKAKVAFAATEKKLKKRLKDLENSSKKDKQTLERRLTQIEKNLNQEVATNAKGKQELEALRVKAKELRVLQAEVPRTLTLTLTRTRTRTLTLTRTRTRTLTLTLTLGGRFASQCRTGRRTC